MGSIAIPSQCQAGYITNSSASQPSLFPRTLPELRSTLIAAAACNAVGIAGGASSARSVREWLPTLDKPPYQPPGWLFGPVWTLLCSSMGVSLSALRRTPDSPARARAERLFAVQLTVNALWSFLFFTRRSPRAALVDAVLIVIAVAATVRAIWQLHRPAALILLPYLAWTCFALVLNADLVRRNR
ncbi:MAG TPA: TspO/MBR family protein [Jatrophihabitans sp.]|nr:TspO/MBR family protein [Jatrophihabitans sp.]